MNTKGRPNSFFKRNGLSLVLLTLLLLSLAGHMAAGLSFSNGQRVEHGQSEQLLVQYLSSGEFLSSLMENWESEFLQMGLYVLLTVRLRQYGSPNRVLSTRARRTRRRNRSPSSSSRRPCATAGYGKSCTNDRCPRRFWRCSYFRSRPTSSTAGDSMPRSNSRLVRCRRPWAITCSGRSSGSSRCRTGERIHGGPGAGPAIDRAEAEGFAPVETGRGAQFAYRSLAWRCEPP